MQPGGYISCAATTTSRTRVGQRRPAVHVCSPATANWVYSHWVHKPRQTGHTATVFTSHGRLGIQRLCSPATANWAYSDCVHQPRQTGHTAIVFTSHGKLGLQPLGSPATANWAYSHCVHQPRQTGPTANVFTSHGKLGIQPLGSPATANWAYSHWVLTALHKASYCATACHNNVCHNTTTRCVIQQHVVLWHDTVS